MNITERWILAWVLFLLVAIVCLALPARGQTPEMRPYGRYSATGTFAPSDPVKYSTGAEYIDAPVDADRVNTGTVDKDYLPDNLVYNDEATTFTEEVVFEKTLEVDGNSVFASDVSVGGDAGIDGTLTVSRATETTTLMATQSILGSVLADKLTITESGSNTALYTICHGPQNTTTGQNYAVVMGTIQGTASGYCSVAIGGDTPIASGEQSACFGGHEPVASGQYSVALGGHKASATGNQSIAIGGKSTASHTQSIVIGTATTGSYSSFGANTITIGAENGIDLVGNISVSGTKRISSAGAGTLASVTLPNLGWVGLGPDIARLEWTNTTRDVATIKDADFKVYESSSTIPALALVEQGNAAGYAQLRSSNSNDDYIAATMFGRSATGTTAGIARAGLACFLGYPNGGGFLVASMTAYPLILGANGAAYWTLTTSGHLEPRTTGAYNLGSDSKRVSMVYCDELDESSDRRLKENIRPLADEVRAGAALRVASDDGASGDFTRLVAALRPVAFERVAEADDTSSRTAAAATAERTEVGFVAQDVADAFEACGMDAFALGIVSRGPSGSLGLRYSRLSAFMAGAIQEQERRLVELEARVEELERRR